MQPHRWPTPIARAEQGSLALGLMIGMLVGLALAVVVAVFVTRAPLPFVNKVPRVGERLAEIKPGAELPDPNRATGSRPAAVAALPAGPAPATPVPASPQAAPAQTAPTPGTEPAAQTAPSERALYMLQAGAFRSTDDADNMRAKLALIGFEARISATEAGNERLYRVRIGPYSQQDDVNLARFRLAENGIEATVVRQR
jgi:cell division protein FtsN